MVISREERVKTGIEGLDNYIQGGFPPSSSILLIGPPGSGKTIFCNQFIYHGLTQGEAAIYIVFDAPPNQIKESMEKFGWEIRGKIIIFVDVYSWKTGGVSETYSISDPTDLNNFNITLSKAIKELQEKNLKFRTAIDSLSTLFLYVPEDLCIKFASIILAKFKRAESTQLVVINEGVLSKMAMIKLNSITDGTIRLNVDEKGERTLKIERMRETRHTLKNLKFKIIDKKGIVIG